MNRRKLLAGCLTFPLFSIIKSAVLPNIDLKEMENKWADIIASDVDQYIKNHNKNPQQVSMVSYPPQSEEIRKFWVILYPYNQKYYSFKNTTRLTYWIPIGRMQPLRILDGIFSKLRKLGHVIHHEYPEYPNV